MTFTVRQLVDKAIEHRRKQFLVFVVYRTPITQYLIKVYGVLKKLGVKMHNTFQPFPLLFLSFECDLRLFNSLYTEFVCVTVSVKTLVFYASVLFN